MNIQPILFDIAKMQQGESENYRYIPGTEDRLTARHLADAIRTFKRSSMICDDICFDDAVCYVDGDWMYVWIAFTLMSFKDPTGCTKDVRKVCSLLARPGPEGLCLRTNSVHVEKC